MWKGKVPNNGSTTKEFSIFVPVSHWQPVVAKSCMKDMHSGPQLAEGWKTDIKLSPPFPVNTCSCLFHFVDNMGAVTRLPKFSFTEPWGDGCQWQKHTEFHWQHISNPTSDQEIRINSRSVTPCVLSWRAKVANSSISELQRQGTGEGGSDCKCWE